jgi:hypothetical protein
MGKRTDLRRSLKSPKKKREKGQKKTEIKSERLRREVEARAVSLMYARDPTCCACSLAHKLAPHALDPHTPMPAPAPTTSYEAGPTHPNPCPLDPNARTHAPGPGPMHTHQIPTCACMRTPDVQTHTGSLSMHVRSQLMRRPVIYPCKDLLRKG